MRRPLLAVAAVGLLAVAALLPLAGAAPEDARERPAYDRHPSERAHERAQARVAQHNGTPFHVEISGTGTDADNATYTITLYGDGRARILQVEENLTGMKGLAYLHGVITDANGTIVKEGDFLTMVRARETDDGVWRWQLVSRGQTRFTGIPKILLQGGATGPAEGALDLDGHGFTLLKADGDQERRLRLRLDVEGTFTRADVA